MVHSLLFHYQNELENLWWTWEESWFFSLHYYTLWHLRSFLDIMTTTNRGWGGLVICPSLRKGEGRGEISTSLADGQPITLNTWPVLITVSCEIYFTLRRRTDIFVQNILRQKLSFFPSNHLRTKHLFTYKAPACGSITYTKPETLM